MTRNDKQAALMDKLNAVLDEALEGSNDPMLLPSALGQLLAQRKAYDKFSTEDNTVSWMMDCYTAAIVGPLAENLLKLHQFLVSSGATPEKPHDFEHADRYGVAFSDAAWKSMALMTQSYTYMVVLQPDKRFSRDATGELQMHDTWAIHIRLCTPGPRSNNHARAAFASLAFLTEHEAVYPEVGYGRNANDYFRYKDGRDRGYLCSVSPNLTGEGFTMEHSLWGAAFSYLGGVLYDLGCHCSCLPKEAS